MDQHWIEAAMRERRRVGIVMGALAAAINPNEAAPMVRPAVVAEKAGQPETDRDDVWWCLVFVAEGLDPLPQMMREDEILGFWPDLQFVLVEESSG
jgi:hypothetical protein